MSRKCSETWAIPTRELEIALAQRLKHVWVGPWVASLKRCPDTNPMPCYDPLAGVDISGGAH